ncbi:MAG: RIP metalloprotease RseP [Gammaproteobacteria bacterium]
MEGFFTSVLAFVVAISILVAVHEYGHFWVARRLGIKVLRFSIGFGKPFWSRQGADGTEYCLAAIPLGGYVKLLDERDCDVRPEEVHLAFNRQSPMRRIAVLLAGPAFNFLFAVVAYWVMFVGGVPAMKPLVGEVSPGSPAAEAGIRSGDVITEVDGHRTETMTDAQLAILDGIVGDGRVSLQIRGADGSLRAARLEVAGETRGLTEPGALFPGLGLSAWRPEIPPVIGELSADGSAAASGLQTGDRVVAAAGEAVNDWSDWVDFIRARPGETVELVVERDGSRQRLALAIGEAQEEGVVIGRIGAAPQLDSDLWAPLRTEQRYGPLEAFPRAAEQTWRMSAVTLSLLGRMVVGDVSLKNLSGPLTIAEGAGATASAGATFFISFLALVSLSLGIINLMPIPLLDGGQIVYQVAEMVKGSPVSERAQLVGQQVGILMLLVIMGFAFYNDIVRLAG